MKILYEGKDIFDDISINQCWYEQYAARRSDKLTIRFNDTESLWDSWQPKTGDKIQVKEGLADTGIMYIDTIEPKSGIITLSAYSYPPTAKDEKSKSWNNISFLSLAQYVADNNGLTLETYEVEDKTYKYVAQKNCSDFAFLQQRAILEGCSFVVYNQKLILYNESKMEKTSSTGTIEIKKGMEYRPDLLIHFEYSDNRLNAYEVISISNGMLKGSYSCGNGTSKKLNLVLHLPMTDSGEAERFAKNILRSYNKDSQSGVMSKSFDPKYSAGSVVTLKNETNPSWDGDVFITSVRHDFVNLKTKIEFRKLLEGY